MRILVLSAHPDDEILGVGGTIKKNIDQNNEIKIAIMATGIFSRRNSNFKNSFEYDSDTKAQKIMKKELKTLRSNALKASKVLGVSDIDFYDFPDNEMDKVSNLEVTKSIEKIIHNFKPEVVFTHSNTDLNLDHRIIHNATLTATRPTPNSSVKEVISYEVPSSTEWNFSTPTFSPNLFIDISKELKFKLKAMSQYKTELRKFPHPRSLEGIETIAKRWGTVCGSKSAEAFSVVREIRR
tara:strand:+ start:513 stop:1229 length:717 start_codon:yes stop_codon:yes gene_type:complete